MLSATGALTKVRVVCVCVCTRMCVCVCSCQGLSDGSVVSIMTHERVYNVSTCVYMYTRVIWTVGIVTSIVDNACL